MTRLVDSLIRVAVCFLLCAALAACDGDTSPSSSQDVGSETSKWDDYVVGLEKTGDKGLFRVRLLLSDPIPQDTGFYHWTIHVVTSDDSPVVGATVVAEPTMPGHGHGTYPPTTEAEEQESPGHYLLSDLDLFMAGVWRIEIVIESSGGESDRVEYNFDLEG